MAAASDPNQSRTLFEVHFETIERVVDYLSYRYHLSVTEADDFRSVAHLRLLADDCDVLRSFEGRGTILGYLSMVIGRMLLDFRRQAWGKWRPSAEAERLGPSAILFEQLTSRDGYTVDQAHEIMVTNHRVEISRADVERLAAALPLRQRRLFDSDASLEDTPAPSTHADDLAVESEAVRRSERVGAAVRTALQSLGTRDRLVLVMRFRNGWTVRQIASTLGLDQKALFRAIERMLKKVREHMEREGIDSAIVLQVLGSERAVFELGRYLEEVGESGPSLSPGAREWQ
jgi:RNA polymerase sigma factor (sigma-70 family)